MRSFISRSRQSILKRGEQACVLIGIDFAQQESSAVHIRLLRSPGAASLRIAQVQIALRDPLSVQAVTLVNTPPVRVTDPF